MKARKLLGWLLTLCIAAGLCTAVLPGSAEAYTIGTYKNTYVTVGVKVADVKSAGTDGSIYLKVDFTEGAPKEYKMDTDKYDDFERNSYKDYRIKIEGRPAWQIKKLTIKNSSKDGMCIAYVHYQVEFGGKTVDIWDGTSSSPINYWVDKSERGKDASVLRREANPNSMVVDGNTTYLSFRQAFGGNTFLDAGSSGKEVRKWGGVLADQYDSIYDMYRAPNPGSLTYTISGIGTNGTTSTKVFNDYFKPVKEKIDGTEYIYGYSFERDKVYKLMKANGFNKLVIQETLTLDKKTCKGTTTYSNEFTIRLKTFDVGTPTITTSFYTEGQDRYYFNTDLHEVKIEIPVITGSNRNNYDAGDIANNMSWSSAKLIYGPGADDYVTVKSASVNGSSKVLTFDLSGKKFDNPVGQYGLKLELEKFQATFRTSYTNNSYVTYDFVGRNGSTDLKYSYDFSQYKYDSVAPQLTVESKDGEPIADTWRQSLNVVTTVTNNNTTYPVTNRNGKVGEDNIDTYELWLEENGSKVLLKTSGGTVKDKLSVANMAGYTTGINLAKHTEGSVYRLVVHGYDAAANEFRYEIPGIKLDNQAPRATLTESAQIKAADGSKSIQYTFAIQDLSGTGKVHYCFLEAGKELPGVHNESRQSGTITSLLNEWAYVEQNDAVGSTIVLKIAEGEQFNGTLYYYTTDDCGNDSRTEKRELNQEQYDSKSVFLDNAAAGCTVNLKTYDHPLSDYSDFVSFTPDAGCTVYYRYRSTGGQYIKYVPGVSKPGSALQVGANGLTAELLNGKDWQKLSPKEKQAYMLKGNQILEYKVVNNKSGNTNYFEGENGIPLYFENYDSVITISRNSTALSPLTQSFAIRASDDSGITGASFRIEAVGGTAAVKTGSLSVSGGVVNDTLNLTEIGNGCYTLTVSATDGNGNLTEYTSEPFTIRTTVPSVTVTVGTNETVTMTERTDGSFLLNEACYTLKLDVTEAYAGTAAAGRQLLKYRVSADGGRYSDWMTAEELVETATGYALQITLNTPVALSEGENRVYIQLLCADEARSLNGLNSGNAAILTLDPIAFYVDVEAPAYELELNTFARTNEAVTAYLRLYDNEAGALTLDFADAEDENNANVTWATQIEMPKEPASAESGEEPAEENGRAYKTEGETASGTEPETELVDLEENTYLVTFKTNEARLKVTDAAGNVTLIPFQTDLYDVTPPVISFTTGTAAEGDDRIDGIVYICVEEADSSLTEISLVGDDLLSGSHFSVTQTSTVRNEDGTTTCEYTAVIKGVTGRYSVAVTALDDVGNRAEETSNPVSVRYPTEFKILDAKDQEKALTSARSEITFNVPVYVLPTAQMTGDSEKDEEKAAVQAQTEGTAIVQKVTLSSELTGAQAFNLVVADEFGNTAVLPYSCSTDFGNGYAIQYSLQQYLVTDDGTWTPIDPLPDGNYLAGWTTEPWGYPRYATVLTVTAADGEVPLAFNLDYGSYESFYFWAHSRWNTEGPVSIQADKEFPDYYSTAIFSIDGPYSPAYSNYGAFKQLTLDCCPVSDLSDPDHVWQTNVLTFDNIVCSEPAVTLTMTPLDQPTKEVQLNVSPVSFDEKTVLDEEDQEMREPVEVTRISLFMLDYVEVTENGETWFEPQRVEVAAWEKEADSQTSGLSFAITENGIYELEIENEYGLIGACVVDVPEEYLVESGNVSYFEDWGGEGMEIVINNIHDDPLDDSDFEVSYQLLPSGDPVDPADGIYANRVLAVITEVPEEEPVLLEWEAAAPNLDLSRYICARNNNGSLEVELTPNRTSFTFLLSDRYGYTYEQEVHYDYFDTQAPSVSLELNIADGKGQPVNPENTGDPTALAKTSGDVLLYVNAADGESRVDTVILSKAGKEIARKQFENGEADLTETFTITENGSYSVTVTDRCGNRRMKSVTVSNIDKTPPEMYVTYSATATTQEDVTASFTFSKPNVTVLKVEPVAPLTENDYVYSKVNGSISFRKNGSVALSYRDEAGNVVEADLITVNNIYTDPPKLKAVVNVAEDDLSVTVTFEKERDPSTNLPLDQFRSLSDLTVRCGNSRIYLVEDSEGVPAEFKMTQNGDYTFVISDAYGLTQNIVVTVDKIDTAAPKVTAVSWTYTYLDANGDEQIWTETLDDPAGAGWRIAGDAYPRTNSGVAVTVKTDVETGFVGGSAAYAQEHQLIYRENGMYIFNLTKKNGLTANFGVDVEVIDTTPPVITAKDGSALGELVFIEGTQSYSKALLEDCTATDTFGDVVTTVPVEIIYGEFKPESLEQNKFDKSHPYYIIYRAKDEAGNVMEVTRKVTLIAFDDVLVTVNGELPDSSGNFADNTGKIRLDLVNYAGGTAYVKHSTGKYTLGQMKSRGDQITRASDGSFTITGLTNGWHTFYVQTATRDYFLITVFVSK